MGRYIEHDYHYGFDQAASSSEPPLALTDAPVMLTITDTPNTDGSAPDCLDRPDQSASTDDARDSRNGSVSSDCGESMSPQHQPNVIATKVTSDGKLQISMRSVGEGTRRPYQSSRKMWVQLRWFRLIAPWFRADAVGGCGEGGGYLDFWLR